MAKVKFKDEKQFEEAKKKTKGVVTYRKFKNGRIIACKSKIQRKKKG